MQKLISRINRRLERLEQCSTVSSEETLPYAPILIVSAPRSGSTLLYQCLVHRYNFGYFSNLHHTFYRGPSVIERFLAVTKWPRRRSESSYYGHIKGWASPSECWKFWYRFFPTKPQYVELNDVDPDKMGIMRVALHEFMKVTRRALLVKNQPSAMRLRALSHYLPEALYVVVSRDLEHTARSILAMRMTQCGDYNQWIGLQPPGIDELRTLPPHEQVVEQVRQTYSIIERDQLAIGKDRFFHLTYDELCVDPHATMERLEKFLIRHGVDLPAKKTIPTSFHRREPPRVNKDMERLMSSYIKEVPMGGPF